MFSSFCAQLARNHFIRLLEMTDLNLYSVHCTTVTAISHFKVQTMIKRTFTFPFTTISVQWTWTFSKTFLSCSLRKKMIWFFSSLPFKKERSHSFHGWRMSIQIWNATSRNMSYAFNFFCRENTEIETIAWIFKLFCKRIPKRCMYNWNSEFFEITGRKRMK